MALTDLADCTDLDTFGGKAVGLSRLIRAGLPVPRGFCIPTDELETFLESNGSRLKSDRPGDELQQIILSEAFSAASLDRFYSWVVQYSDNFRTPLTCRSSAPAEDSQARSFAGIFSSVGNIYSFPDFTQALREVWGSLFSERACEYRERFGLPVTGMAVVVQEMVPVTSSGVVFSQAPDRKDCLCLEAVRGYGESLVSGLTTPDRYWLSRRRLEQEEIRLSADQLCLQYLDPQAAFRYRTGDLLPIPGKNRQQHFARIITVERGRNSFYVETPPDLVGEAVVEASDRRAIAGACLKIEALFSSPVDCEWALDTGGKLYILQARPITQPGQPADVSAERAASPQGEILAVGETASSGVSEGCVCVVTNPGDMACVKPGEILVIGGSMPSSMVGILKARALITEEIGVLSHTAIVCREVGIPCLTNVSDATRIFRSGDLVVVNADAGVVTRSTNIPACDPSGPGTLPEVDPGEPILYESCLVEMLGFGGEPACLVNWISPLAELLQEFALDRDPALEFKLEAVRASFFHRLADQMNAGPAGGILVLRYPWIIEENILFPPVQFLNASSIALLDFLASFFTAEGTILTLDGIARELHQGSARRVALVLDLPDLGTARELVEKLGKDVGAVYNELYLFLPKEQHEELPFLLEHLAIKARRPSLSGGELLLIRLNDEAAKSPTGNQKTVLRKKGSQP